MTRIRISSPHANAVVSVALCLSALVIESACSTEGAGVPDEQLGGLVQSTTVQRRAIDKHRVHKDVDELVHAATLPHDQVTRLLGAHRYRSSARVVVREGDGTESDPIVDTLNVDTRIEMSAEEDFHAVNENSKEYGREVRFVDGFLYIAPRYSQFHRRRPERSVEPVRIRADMYGDLGAHLELIARGIAIADAESIDGSSRRPTRTVRIQTAAMRPVNRSEAFAHRSWRDRVQVQEASGELTVDTETGIIVRASIRGALTFARDARKFAMTFDVSHAITDIGATIGVSAPADDRWVSTPLRSREVAERDQLLDGIAPPTRKHVPRTKAPRSSSRKPSRGGTK